MAEKESQSIVPTIVLHHVQKPIGNSTAQYLGIPLFLWAPGETESRKTQSVYLFGAWSKVKFKNRALLAKVKPKIKMTPQTGSICCQSQKPSRMQEAGLWWEMHFVWESPPGCFQPQRGWGTDIAHCLNIYLSSARSQHSPDSNPS